MYKVLIVEDDDPLRDALRDSLTRDGFEVHEAVNGEEGLEKAIELNPDLILLDILMPKVNGMEMLKNIRAHEEISETPVIILSNLSPHDSEIIRSLVSAKPSYYLLKADWSLKEIREKINEILG